MIPSEDRLSHSLIGRGRIHRHELHLYTCTAIFLKGIYQIYLMNFYKVTSRSQCVVTQRTQKNCVTFIQLRPNVFDVGPTLCKCCANVLCLLGSITHMSVTYDMLAAQKVTKRYAVG